MPVKPQEDGIEADLTTENTSHKTLEAALFAAWCGMASVTKNKSNPAFRSKYADINSVLDVVVPALQKHGVRLSQAPIHGDEPNRAYLRTRLSHHVSGESEEFITSARLEKDNAQGVIGASTYLRRVALTSYFDLSCEDDDGNVASGVSVPATAPNRVGGGPINGGPPSPPAGLPRPPARPVNN